MGIRDCLFPPAGLRRHVPLKRALVSRARRAGLIATACDLSLEVYQATVTDEDAYICDIATDVRVGLGTRVCENKRYTTVTFCGTESLYDWFFNLMLWLVACDDGIEGRVHAGFCCKWKAVSAKVIDAVRRLGGSRVLITGHSMGGALASIAAIDIARALPNVDIIVYTFGAPRCGDDRFHGTPLPKNIVRFVRCVHAGDFVQSFPPLPGYAHPTHARLLVVGRNVCDLHRPAVAVEAERRFLTHALWLQLQRLWRGRFRLEHHQIFAYRRAILTNDL